MSRFVQRFPQAFVTGGSSGLGLALVRGLIAEGVQVWASSRKAERIQNLGIDVHAVELELSDGAAVDQLLTSPPWERLPTLLVNNAGYGQFGHLQTMTAADFEEQVAAMLTSAMRLSRHFLVESPADAPASAVVNVSSLAAEFPLPFQHGYNAVKAGLSGFSRSLALEFPGGKGRPFAIDLRPGDYRTGFNEAIRRPDAHGDLAKVWDAVEHHLANGADPAKFWPGVRKALLRESSRSVRIGTFFQARCAPFGSRILPASWMEAIQRRYYRMDTAGSR